MFPSGAEQEERTIEFIVKIIKSDLFVLRGSDFHIDRRGQIEKDSKFRFIAANSSTKQKSLFLSCVFKRRQFMAFLWLARIKGAL